MQSDPPSPKEIVHEPGVVLNCGWGRLIFGHTFPDPASVAAAILDERSGQRDIAFYLNDPQIILNCAPQDLFLDPSTFHRLSRENHRADAAPVPGLSISTLKFRSDVEAINSIYKKLNMAPVDPNHVWARRSSERFRYFLARHAETGASNPAPSRSNPPSQSRGRSRPTALFTPSNFGTEFSSTTVPPSTPRPSNPASSACSTPHIRPMTPARFHFRFSSHRSNRSRWRDRCASRFD